MDVKQREKLTRYLKNADRFLWGLAGRNQKCAYNWLKSKGLNAEGAYARVIEELLASLGIEGILKDLVVPRVAELFRPELREYLKTCWDVGTKPNISILKYRGLDDANRAHPFLEINTQFDYVERWGEFAGLWFEDIEPWIAQSSEKQPLG